MAEPAAETRPEPICGMNTWMPVPARVLAVQEENFNTRTYTLQFIDEQIRKMYRFAPGQFNMVYVPGVGEAAISISSDPEPHRHARPHHPPGRLGYASGRTPGRQGAGRAARSVRPRLAGGGHGGQGRGDRRRRHRAGAAATGHLLALAEPRSLPARGAAVRLPHAGRPRLRQRTGAVGRRRLDPSPRHRGQRHRRPGPARSAW